MEDLTWRGATADDEPLLRTLFAANKAPEFAPLGWSAEQLQPLLEMQYRARSVGYAQSYPAATDMILCLGDGTAVGRHLMERQPNGYRTIDIGILPEFQRRGIGTWALRQAQQIAALEGVPLRLSVLRMNVAQRLYERLGFVATSSDAISIEMEWQPAAMLAARPRPAEVVAVPDGSTFDRVEVIERIFAFLREIGLTIELGTVPTVGFLPGVQLVRNGLRVDMDGLLYPGDLLHEAGHLAVITPERRAEEFPVVDSPAEEMAALAWSYAAAVHIGLPAEVVFHDAGYRGQARMLAKQYRNHDGQAVGLPMLWYLGLTTQHKPDSPSIYPRMLRWLRGEDRDDTHVIQESATTDSSYAGGAGASTKELCNA